MAKFDWVTVLGVAAAVCTTTSFVPQMVKTLRSRHTGDISLLMYIVLTVGLFLWLVYGFLRKDMPLMAANGVSFTLAAAILFLKIRHH
ncbi:MAG: SemiSWEET transporter [Deltaproteobacteria bacterium]